MTGESVISGMPAHAADQRVTRENGPYVTRKITYRPDIDGLRSIAVGAVVIFHLFGVMGGGYLGVDIFFVISGFLITSILIRENEVGNYSIISFYERRIRRIIPALIFMLIVISAIAVMVLLPSDLIRFGWSILATLSFVSNIYFWRDADYFSPAAETKPLLHTWSLGVEEQFYVIFPVVIAFIYKFFRKNSIIIISCLASLSLALTIFILHLGKGSVAFYLLPTRAWELGAGAIVALSTVFPPGRRVAGFFSFIGLGLIAVFLFEANPYRWAPLPTALPAVLGTALLLWAGQTKNPISGLLANRPMVWGGLISYSLYLWHWPIYVLLRYRLIDEPGFVHRSLMLFSAIAAAYLSWRYVEKPFRSRSMLPSRVLALTGAGVLIMALVAVGFVASKGLPRRLPEEASRFNRFVGTNYRCPPASIIPFGYAYACSIFPRSINPDRAKVALLGDSFAQMYAPALAPGLKDRQIGGILVPANGCLPLATLNRSTGCGAAFRANRDALLALPHLELVFIAASWENLERHIVDTTGRAVPAALRLPRALDDLQNTAALFAKQGKRLVFVAPIATPGMDLASVVSREIAFHGKHRTRLAMPRAEYEARYGALRQWMSEGKEGAGFIDPAKILCDYNECHFADGDGPFFADSGHISVLRIQLFETVFDKDLNMLIKNSQNRVE